MNRRNFMQGAAVFGAAVVVGPRFAMAANGAAMVKIATFDADGKATGVQTVAKVQKSDAEWKKQLQPMQYAVARHAETERPYSGATWNEHAHGVFRCVCCDLALFRSETKFDSHTGWPSFYQPIAKENVNEKTDMTLGMERTEVLCRQCDAHLGHVFDDGPRPTGMRYCMNSAAMTFHKTA